MNAVVQETRVGVVRWVTFRLAEECYGIDVMQVQEVLRVPDVAAVPGAPAFVMGIINLRGNVVTVLDARKLLALAAGDVTDNTRILIVEANGLRVGLLVDSVAEVVDIAPTAIDPPPTLGKDEGARYILGVHSTAEQILILIDLDRLIREDARGALAVR
jgi:purine-binding chemotaxis protein CheW